MAKKNNRQQDPNDSSDSGDTNATSSAPCKHIPKAVQLGNVKKKLKGGIRTSCDACAKKTKHANIVPDVSLCNEEEVTNDNWTYWMCLTCAHIGCGRAQLEHALSHYRTPRSESHDLVVDIDTWIVWCYSCEQKMALNSTRKLQECVEYIRKHMQSSSKSMTSVSEDMAQSQSSKTMSVVPSSDKDETDVTQKPNQFHSQTKNNSTSKKNLAKPTKVRGLMNLGNTCFYNSVLQCLSVTPYLTKVLERLTCSGEVFTLPGSAKPEDFEAPLVHGSLGDSGPLSGALLSLLLEMRHPDLHADTLRPQKLLKQVQNAFPQFQGHDQHDAHELLRHLLEGVRADDLKRFQRVILEQYGLLRRKNDEVDSHLKKRIKFYGQQIQDLTLGVEGIFKGQLVSIVECQDCNHHSIRFESFLDLSLPVMEDKPLPPMRKKEPVETFAGDEGLSKYQIRKRQKAEKKARKNKRGEKIDACLTIAEEPAKCSDEHESAEESDADVEDNVEQDARDATKEVVESGYSSDKQNTGESDGTSPSIGAAGGEAVEDTKHPEQEPTPVAPALAPGSPAVSASLTASASPSPTASASPTAPASSGGPTSPTTLQTQPVPPSAPAPASVAQPQPHPAQDWSSSSFHTPEHGDADADADAACAYNCKGLGQTQPRCFTPVDEELRITIPESGEGSIHISPVQPTGTGTGTGSERDRPVSRRGFFPGDTRRSGVGGDCESGVGPDFAPELENRLLSLCLSSNRVVNEEVDSGVTDGNGNNDAMECAKSMADIDENRRKIDEWYEGQKPAFPDENIVCNNNEGNGNNNSNNKEDYMQETKSSKSKTNLVTDKPTQHSASGDSTDDKAGWCKTLGSRHQTEEGECSVISCLNQFTSVELMTGNNKVGCDACTQRQNKGSEGKTVYTNSTKMFLISSPPPVLILHLKRFMMENYRFKKLQRFVSFPLELDIAPFCSMKCRESPSFQGNQTEIKYSLFGIVEHTGSLNTGHYLAYIKVRANLGENDPRWSYLPRTREFVYPKVDSCDSASNGTQMEEKWYSISDSRVVEIAEAKVLKIQAYLLFYERVV